MRLLGPWLVVVVVGLGCGSGDAKPKSPSASPNGKCDKAYNPPVCLGDQPKCETDANGCEICTCDQSSALPPGH